MNPGEAKEARRRFLLREQLHTASLIAGIVMGVLGTSDRAVAELPPRFLPSAMVCTGDSALILGGERGEYLPGERALFEEEAVAFNVHRDNPDPQRIPVGTGFVLDASQPEAGVIYAVRIEWSPDRAEQSQLVRSRDQGQSWEDVDAAPSDIIGVEFVSRDAGWVWSSRRAYHTRDAGASWSGVDAPGLLPRGSPRPVVDRTGALWIAVGHGTAWKPEENAIARILPNLQVEPLLQSTEFRVWEMDVSDAGDIWFLAEEAGRVSLRRLRPEQDGSDCALVAELPGGLPDYLRIVGSEIVAVLSKTGADDERFLMISKDLGATWKQVRPPEPRVRRYCALTADKIWMVGSSGAVYPPK
jgi:hypothetical protein